MSTPENKYELNVLNDLNHNFQNAFTNYMHEYRLKDVCHDELKRLLQRAIEDIASATERISKQQSVKKAAKKSKSNKKKNANENQHELRESEDKVEKKKHIEQSQPSNIQPSYQLQQQLQSGIIQQQQHHEPKIITNQYPPLQSQQQTSVSKLRTIDIEQSNKDGLIENKLCIYCQNCDIKLLNLGQLFKFKDYYVHKKCQENVTNIGDDLIENLKFQSVNECKICFKKGAFQQCDMCEQWYHYPCLLRQSGESGDAECKCYLNCNCQIALKDKQSEPQQLTRIL